MRVEKRTRRKVVHECNYFFDSDGIKTEIWGYHRSRFYTFLTYMGYLLTGGILRLVFHWLPHWQLYATHRRCPLPVGNQVLIMDQYKRYSVHNVLIFTRDGTRVKVVTFCKFSNEVHGSTSSVAHISTSSKHGSYNAVQDQITRNGYTVAPLDAPASTPLLIPDIQDTSLTYHFMYKKMKYIWDMEKRCFRLSPGWENARCSQFHEALPLDSVTAYRRQIEFGENNITIPITPLMEMLVKEGLNPFYVFQIASCTLWYIDQYWMFATCIVVISATTLLWQLYELRKNEQALRDTVCSSGTAFVCRNSSDIFTETDAAALVPGDILEIPRIGCTMHCDAVLISGNCIVNESMLTGESVPITKTPLPNTKARLQSKSGGASVPPRDELFDIKNHSRHILFCGTRVLQARAYEGEKVRAVVARVGFSTAKGELVRSILFPKPVVFKFNRDAGRYIMVLGLMAMLGFFYTIVIMIQRDFPIIKIFIRALDLITIVVPPALPVAMTVGIVFAQNRLKKKDVFCISPNTINVCGVTNVVCFDKTGTLTEEGLDLWGLVPLDSTGQFSQPERDPKEMPLRSPLVECMATCHSLTCINGVLSGDPLDLIMFHSVNWELVEETSDNKFGMSVPAIVRPRLLNQEHGIHYDTNYPHEMEIAILRQFTFSSSLQRMSVIVRSLNSQVFTLYVKGAPEMVQQLCRRDTLPTNYHTTLLQYTREGYRVLALAWRPLKISYVKMQRIQREAVECELRFLGLLILENRLKSETTPVIETLKSANIRPVMVTGDNMLTALSVARDCNMIEEFEKIIVVNANPPTFLHTTNAGIIFPNGRSGDTNTPLLADTTVATTCQVSMDDLVEFHYAEDLQKPVTEVTAAKIRQRLSRTNSQAMLRRFTTSGSGMQSHTITLADITVRMMDRPDFHLAMSGRTWSIIREYCPHLLPKLLVKGTVFARFSPDQKTQLIESLQSLGYYVMMCGDGANDCGALKTAHAGISLSEAEASVASPFTSKRQNISCVPDLIKEGRCALATSFGTFKFMAGYSLTQFASVLLLYWIGANLADFQFLYIDLMLITTLSITFGHTGAYDRLSIDPPSVRLVSTVTLTSLILQVGVNILFQTAAYLYVTHQPWYLPYIVDVTKKDYQCHETTAVFTVSAFQYIIIAIVFSKGPPYRKTILQNPLFLMNCIVVTLITIYALVFSFEWLKFTLLLLTDYPSIYPKLILLSMALANFLLAYLFEVAVDGMAFRHRIRRVKRALFPKMFSHKEYERIRDEIDRAAWPPLTRSASVQDLRPDIFTDGAAVVTTMRDTEENLHRSRSVDPNTMLLLQQQAAMCNTIAQEALSSTSEDNEAQEEMEGVATPLLTPARTSMQQIDIRTPLSSRVASPFRDTNTPLGNNVNA